MKSKKVATLSAMALLACGVVFNYTNNSAKKKTETKEVTLKAGERYRLPMKKIGKYKITISKRKIVSVNKKGVLHALKNGKCVVSVSSKNKKYKYKIVVNPYKKAEQQQAELSPVETQQAQFTPAPAPSATYIPYVTDCPYVTPDPNVTYAPPGGAGIISVLRGIVSECTETEDGMLNYKLKITQKSIFYHHDKSINYAYVLAPASKKLELNSEVYVVKSMLDENDVINGDTVTVSGGYIIQ